MPDADVPGEALAIVEVIAGAIRDELGEEIDAYPGCRGPRGPTRSTAPSGPSSARSWRRTTSRIETCARARLPGAAPRRRAAAGGRGLGRPPGQVLIDEEPGSPDDWLAFLILSPRGRRSSRCSTPDDPDLA